jgi:hypothetical protein
MGTTCWQCCAQFLFWRSLCSRANRGMRNLGRPYSYGSGTPGLTAQIFCLSFLKFGSRFDRTKLGSSDLNTNGFVGCAVRSRIGRALVRGSHVRCCSVPRSFPLCGLKKWPRHTRPCWGRGVCSLASAGAGFGQRLKHNSQFTQSRGGICRDCSQLRSCAWPL